MHRRLEEDVDESGNEKNIVPDTNNIERQEIAGETLGEMLMSMRMKLKA